LDTKRAFSHANVTDLGNLLGEELLSSHVKEVRFYAKSSGHSRVIHFKSANLGLCQLVATEDGTQFQAARAVSSTAQGWWSRKHQDDGWTPLSGHNAFSPDSANGWHGSLSHYLYYEGGSRTWAIKGSGFRWEVDDHVAHREGAGPRANKEGFDGMSRTTLHQIWVRFHPQAPIRLPGQAVPTTSALNKDFVRIQQVPSSTNDYSFSGKARGINFDQNGLLYAIGTGFGARSWKNPFLTGDIGISFSSDACNYYSTQGGHKLGAVKESSSVILDHQHRGANATMWSRGAPDAWFQIDLKHHRFSPNHYVYRGDMGGGENHPRTWSLQGSEDGTSWVDLRRHNNDNTVKRQQNGSWELRPTGRCFRFFRVQNRGRPNHLCCSGIEFYGSLVPNSSAVVLQAEVVEAVEAVPVQAVAVTAITVGTVPDKSSLGGKDGVIPLPTAMKDAQPRKTQVQVPHILRVSGAQTHEEHGQWPNDEWYLVSSEHHGRPQWQRKGNSMDFIRWDGRKWGLFGMQPSCYFQHLFDTPLPPKNGWQAAEKRVLTMPLLEYGEPESSFPDVAPFMHFNSLVLVSADSRDKCIFKAAAVDAVADSLSPRRLVLASPGSGQLSICKRYDTERHHGEWRYIESAVMMGAACSDAVEVTFHPDGFIEIPGRNLVLDVSFWRMQPGATVNFVGGSTVKRTRLNEGARGRCFRINTDRSISPSTRPDLFLGLGVSGSYKHPSMSSKIVSSKMAPASDVADEDGGGEWAVYKDIDMCGQGDARIIPDWKANHSIEDLKQIVIANGYSAFTVSDGSPSFNHAALKSFEFDLTKEHCKPITSCCHHPCKIYIWTGKPKFCKGCEGRAMPSERKASTANVLRLNAELNACARNTNDTGRMQRLVAEGADLTSTNGPPWNHTPMHQAAYHNRPEMVRALIDLCRQRDCLGQVLEMGSNPCGRGGSGKPIELAVGGGHQACATLLKEANAMCKIEHGDKVLEVEREMEQGLVMAKLERPPQPNAQVTEVAQAVQVPSAPTARPTLAHMVRAFKHELGLEGTLLEVVDASYKLLDIKQGLEPPTAPARDPPLIEKAHHVWKILYGDGAGAAMAAPVMAAKTL